MARFRLTPYNHPAPIVVMAYSPGTTPEYHPSASATAAVTAGTRYTITVEVLREDLGDASEYVAAIRIGDDGVLPGEAGTALLNLGACHPDGGDYDCTFFDCGPQLGTVTFTPQTSTMAFELDIVGHSWDCDCARPFRADPPQTAPSKPCSPLSYRLCASVRASRRSGDVDLLPGEPRPHTPALHRRRALHARRARPAAAHAAGAPAAAQAAAPPARGAL